MRRIVSISALTCLTVMMGCRASVPSKVEHGVMTWTKHSVSVGNRSERNALQPSAENLAEGKEAFTHYCVACHGMDGQNTGVPFADRMLPPVPSLASSEVQSYTDGQLKWVIDNGIGPSGMPGSKGILSDEEIWSMVLFIRKLPSAGSLGNPPMYDK
jgi:mono/diheme cytochrome c family protein